MDARVQRWAASGAMALTGRPGRDPLGPPAPLVDEVDALAAALRVSSARVGRPVDVDGLALLGERAALAHLTRQGATSCGGGTRLLPTADGTVAVALVRPDDVASVPAWLDLDPAAVGATADDEVWRAVGAAVARHPAAALVEQAALLGLAVAARGEGCASPATSRSGPGGFGGLPIRSRTFGASAGAGDLDGVVVVDLSALWAGPLCGQLLGAAGARVVKVESTARPDGARAGDGGLFELLNATKQSVALDLTTATGRTQLRDLVRAADVVIEGSRPRALEQLGIGAADLLAAADGPTVWISITGFGRSGADANRIAYGDVAAVAAGIVVDDADGPVFVADAVADPLTGLTAAVGVLEALASGERWLLDVPMVAVAARCAGPQLEVPADAGPDVAPPRARPAAGSARPLGVDTARVLGELVP